jgi:hypothetical protein
MHYGEHMRLLLIGFASISLRTRYGWAWKFGGEWENGAYLIPLVAVIFGVFIIKTLSAKNITRGLLFV